MVVETVWYLKSTAGFALKVTKLTLSCVFCYEALFLNNYSQVS